MQKYKKVSRYSIRQAINFQKSFSAGIDYIKVYPCKSFLSS